MDSTIVGCREDEACCGVERWADRVDDSGKVVAQPLAGLLGERGLEHHDPRVREMIVWNFAALLLGPPPELEVGRVRQQLRRLADGDHDWHVRLAALDVLALLSEAPAHATACSG